MNGFCYSLNLCGYLCFKGEGIKNAVPRVQAALFIGRARLLDVAAARVAPALLFFICERLVIAE